MRYHGITAEYRSTTIRMRGKQLLGTALGQNNFLVGDLRITITNRTGQYFFYKNSIIKLPKRQKNQVQIRMRSYDQKTLTHPRKL